MLRKINIKETLIAGAIAAVLFCIPVSIYIIQASYRQSWLLYVGSFLFFAVIWVNTLRDNKKRGQNESLVTMVFSSHMVTIAGILITCVLCFILLVLFIPGYLGAGNADKLLTGEPANFVKDKTDGLSLDVFM